MEVLILCLSGPLPLGEVSLANLWSLEDFNAPAIYPDVNETRDRPARI